MRIAVIIGGFPYENMGGAEYQAWLLSKGLAAKGHQVTYFDRLIRQALDCSFDVAYVRTTHQLATVAPICQSLSIPLVCGISSIMDCMPILWSHRAKDIVAHWRRFWSLRTAQAIVCQTREQANRLGRYFAKASFHIIPNGHPVPEDCISDEEKSPVVLWINNIKKLKRPGLFIALAASLIDLDVDFVMVGCPPEGSSGKRFEALLERAPQRFRYTGPLGIGEVNKLIAQSILAVNTSKPVEGFPNTFIQSWMRGVPIVSLEVDPDGVIEKEGLGRCSRTFEHLALDVRELISKRELRKSIADRARSYAVQNFDVERMVLQYETLFRKIVV
jgi:glycosyltransferase involved in cell wall biosynthesis